MKKKRVVGSFVDPSVLVVISDPEGLIGRTTWGTSTRVHVLHQIDFFAFLGVHRDIQTKGLELTHEHLEGFGSTGARNWLAFHDGVQGLVTTVSNS